MIDSTPSRIRVFVSGFISTSVVSGTCFMHTIIFKSFSPLPWYLSLVSFSGIIRRSGVIPFPRAPVLFSFRSFLQFAEVLRLLDLLALLKPVETQLIDQQ